MRTDVQVRTAEELFRMPSDNYRYELVKGELRKMTPAGTRHGSIITRLLSALVQHVDSRWARSLGPDTGFKIAESPDTVRAPDIAFVSKERIPAGELTEKFWPGAPDLAVEVISPTDTLYELDEKIEEYMTSGVTLVWVVNPKKRTVTVYRPGASPEVLGERDHLHGSPVLSAFQYPIAKLFEVKHR
jgi:Uma2 family endonuclease